jgi:hypothetical protein
MKAMRTSNISCLYHLHELGVQLWQVWLGNLTTAEVTGPSCSKFPSCSKLPCFTLPAVGALLVYHHTLFAM